MPASDDDQRIRVCGKYFMRGGKPWLVKGLTYGPFGPAEENGGLPDPSRVRLDLDAMVQAGANTVRVYELPPEWFLDACANVAMKVLISVPWTSHVDFLREMEAQDEARRAVREAVSRYRGHEAVFAYLVGNEIEGTLVRWMGVNAVRDFIDSLCLEAKEADDAALVAYGNFPTTEFLHPREGDFCAFNIYLESRQAYSDYLARLQHVAREQPLLICEFGADSKSLGESKQAEILGWAIREGVDAGAMGTVIFAFTDEWYRGHPIHGWDFGIVRRERDPKAAFSVLIETWREWLEPAAALAFSPKPKVSVIVCTHNGADTIGPCLDSLAALDYPDFEIVVVDDGSTDGTAEIAGRKDGVKLVKQERGGLSAARNRGAREAAGEILAYTDDDCFVEKDWLTHVLAVMARQGFDACGGPNIPPETADPIEALVAIAPGAPVQVMLDDRRAEHLPGCNLCVRREAFEKAGGFCEEFRVAGDDVDFCWRLRDAGMAIGFAPAGFVWHHRRSTVGAYLRQQAGYGKAEALLAKRHPDRFGNMGGAFWRGAIYEPHHRPPSPSGGHRLFRGVFGTALFPRVYAHPSSDLFNLVSSVPWMAMILAFILGGFFVPFLFLPAAGMCIATVAATGRRAFDYRIPRKMRNWKSRFLLFAMCVMQPVVRSAARFRLRWPGVRKGRPSPGGGIFRWPRFGMFGKNVGEISVWSDKGLERGELLEKLGATMGRLGHRFAVDDGWRDWDIELRDSRFWRIQLTTVTEYHEDRGRLVRLRFSSAATRMHLGWSLFLGVLIGYVVLSSSSPFRMLWLVGIWLAWWIFLELLHRGQVERLMLMAQRVAYDLGFQKAGEIA